MADSSWSVDQALTIPKIKRLYGMRRTLIPQGERNNLKSAVKIAVSVYVLVAIVKKRSDLGLAQLCYRSISVTLFDE